MGRVHRRAKCQSTTDDVDNRDAILAKGEIHLEAMDMPLREYLKGRNFELNI